MRPPPRKLTVLASLDVAGYTRLVERGRARHADRAGHHPPAHPAADARHPSRQPVQDHGRRRPRRISQCRGQRPLGDRLPGGHGRPQRRPRRGRHPGPPRRRARRRLRPGQRPLRRRRRLCRAPAAGRPAGRHRHHPFGALAARQGPGADLRPYRARRRSRASTSRSRSGCGRPAGPQPRHRPAAATATRYRDHEKPAPIPAPPRSPPRRPSRHPAIPRSPCCPSTTCRAIPPPTPSPTARRGDHRDAVAHPRLHRHRAQLGLCLPRQDQGHARGVARPRRALRAGRQPAQGRRPRARHRPAHRRRQRRPYLGRFL